jgi:hypothetical protein
MLKTRNLLAPALVCAALAACTDGPTLVSDVQAPASPAFSGGHVFGSGAYTADPNTPAVVSMETTAGDSTSMTEERGGHTLGSGH